MLGSLYPSYIPMSTELIILLLFCFWMFFWKTELLEGLCSPGPGLGAGVLGKWVLWVNGFPELGFQSDKRR